MRLGKNIKEHHIFNLEQGLQRKKILVEEKKIN